MSEQDNFEFDLEKSKQKKEEGMARAAMNRKDLLNFARAVAKGTCSQAGMDNRR